MCLASATRSATAAPRMCAGGVADRLLFESFVWFRVRVLWAGVFTHTGVHPGRHAPAAAFSAIACPARAGQRLRVDTGSKRAAAVAQRHSSCGGQTLRYRGEGSHLVREPLRNRRTPSDD